MKHPNQIFKAFRVCCSVTLFVIISLIANLLLIFTLPILPFSRKSFQTLNKWLVTFWWSFGSWILDLAGFHYTIVGDSFRSDESAVIICNHRSMLDIPAIAHLARIRRRLTDIKWVVKEEVKYLPGLGLGLMVIGSLFLKRNWTRDRERIQSAFKRITGQGDPFLLVLFPEGTRFSKVKVESAKAVRHFSMRNMKRFSHVLFPKLKGFVAAVQLLRSNIDAIYDITIIYPREGTLGKDYFLGKLESVTIHIKRTDIKELPEDEASLGEWLVEAFRQKEELFQEFKNRLNSGKLKLITRGDGMKNPSSRDSWSYFTQKRHSKLVLKTVAATKRAFKYF